ncbi:hypothetical protein [Actibacterium sp. 188UL27-1]|uniref:hypothetical protein n=1 Tax=Actibacterium sp. 188UL27-1 TaxID=2786961 RepID=UPI001959805F|nr:hypothetical protein [Actibacterium sp. 188UL27-1]MBM7067760.1 hypothetical protein [Actibacterium sp. 188UL27-1]
MQLIRLLALTFVLAAVSGAAMARETVASLLNRGGEVVSVFDQGGYPTVIIVAPQSDQAKTLYICRTNYEEFFEFADFRNGSDLAEIGSVCANVN